VTRYGLDGPGIENRWGARFFAPAYTGPGTQPASYTSGNRVYFSGVKHEGRDADHPLPSSAKAKERVQLYLYSLWAFMASYGGKFTTLFQSNC
jgi:hypothetical protein